MLYVGVLSLENKYFPGISHVFVLQNICLGNICFKCLHISLYQTFVYQMDISGYVCLSFSYTTHNNIITQTHESTMGTLDGLGSLLKNKITMINVKKGTILNIRKLTDSF